MEYFKDMTEDAITDKFTLIFKLFNVFTSMNNNPFVLMMGETVDKKYEFYYKIKTNLQNISLDAFEVLNSSGLLNKQQVHKYYLISLISDFIDFDKDVIDKDYLLVKNARNAYEGMKKDKLRINQFLNTRLFASAMLRYFMFDFANIQSNELSKYLYRKIIIIMKVCILDSDTGRQGIIHDFFDGIYNKLTEEELKNIYEETYNFLFEEAKEMANQNISERYKVRMANILFFYSVISSMILIRSNESFIKVLKDSLKLLSLLKKEHDVNICLNLIDSKLMKLKYRILPVCYRILTNKAESLMSYHEYGNDNKENNSEDIIMKESSNENNLIELERKKFEEKNEFIKESVREFLIEFLPKIMDVYYLTDITNQIIVIYIFDILVSLSDPYEKKDMELLMLYTRKTYEIFLQKDISTLNAKKVLLSFLSLLLQLIHESQYIYKIEPVEEISSNEEEHNKLIEYYLKYPSIKIRFCDFKPTIGVEKVNSNIINYDEYLKDQQYFSSKEELKSFIIALITTKDLLSDAQKTLKVASDKNISTLNSMEKNWEYKMLYQFFDLHKKNSNFLNYETALEIFSEIEGSSMFDINLITMIKCQIFAALLKIDIFTLREVEPLDPKDIIKIRNILKMFMGLYTKNRNKVIDHSIHKFFTFVLSSFVLRDFYNYLKEDGHYIYFDYGDDFALDIYSILNSILSPRISWCIFNNKQEVEPYDPNANDVYVHFKLIENYLKNFNKLIKKLEVIVTLSENLLYAAQCVHYIPKEFSFYFSPKCKNYMAYLIDLAKNSGDKLCKYIKEIIAMTLYFTQKYFILDPSFLIDSLSFLINDDENFTNFQISSSFQLPISNDLLKDYLKIIKEQFEKKQLYSNIYIKKFLIDFLINIMKTNLMRIINDSDDSIIELLLSIMKSCSTGELREYIMNKLLVFYVNSFTNEKNVTIINNCKNLIKAKEENSDDANLMNIYLLGAFTKTIYLQVPEDIQNIFIFFNTFIRSLKNDFSPEAKLARTLVKEFLTKYKYSFYYVKQSLSEDCLLAIRGLSNENDYFL
ncbi:MAG: hypothetical protein MJ252_01090 [archaeon]|nr:hypothetical protein [archaeon]